MSQSNGQPILSGLDDSLLAELVAEATDRMHAGESVDIDSFAARHPERADEVRRLLGALCRLDASGPPIAGDSEPSPELLGDFRIIREVGRGGMGVVYEAEQRSLGRRVALKVLPFAATMDPRHLQRFKNEARAAASLHHEHIVPVHGVGEERGVHFYAMQFIDGRPLSALIADLRRSVVGGAATGTYDPTGAYVPAEPSASTGPVAAASTQKGFGDREHWRRVADWGIQAAEALEHAHALGIVHRDVKPGNLLIDGHGKLWVADFGLAKLEADAGVTVSGDLLGTLRYMSPEQAMARHGLVDHRTDLYALGATLYELLTVQPVVDGADRQELLKKIAFEEPAEPRKLNKAVPRDLETVVLKCLRKDPERRYASAGELAADLRRFLEHKPVVARRPSLADRARKWALRHRAAVWAVGVGLLMSAAVLGGSVAWVVRDGVERRERTELLALDALRTFDQLLKEQQWPEALLAVRRAEGAMAGGEASEPLRQRVRDARATVELILALEEADLLAYDRIKDGDFDLGPRHAAYARAFTDFGIDLEGDPAQIAARIPPAARVSAAHALFELSDRSNPNGEKGQRLAAAAAQKVDPDEWRTHLRKAVAAKDVQGMVQMAASAPLEELPPSSVSNLGWELVHTGKNTEAVGLLQHALERHPSDFGLNEVIGKALFEMKLPREALLYRMVARALRPGSPGANLNVGKSLGDLERWEEAAAACREAIRVKPDYVEAHCSLGVYLAAKGDPDGAVVACREAIRLKPDYHHAHFHLGNALAAKRDLDGAIAAYREAIRLKPDFAKAHSNLGAALRGKGDLDGAVAAYGEDLRLRPDNATAHSNLGVALCEKGDLAGGIAAYREALRLKPDSAATYNNLGNALRLKGDLGGAISAYRESIHLRPGYAEAHLHLGIALSQNGDLDGAIAAYREAIRLKPDLAEVHYNLGKALAAKGNPDGAVAAYREAIGLKHDFPEAHCNLGDTLKSQGRFAEALPFIRRGHELGAKQPGWPYPSAQWVKDCERCVQLDARLPAVLEGKVKPADTREHLGLAEICLVKKHYVSAARLFNGALAAEPELAEQLNGPRYNAACAAALAGCGRGEDAADLGQEERATLRRQALDWLRAELSGLGNIRKQDPKQRATVEQVLRHWQADLDLAGVRGADALARLPASERPEWERLWNEVDALLRDKDRPQPKRELLPRPREAPAPP